MEGGGREGWMGDIGYNVMTCNGVIGFRVKGKLCE